MELLVVDSCVNPHDSRTRRLGDALETLLTVKKGYEPEYEVLRELDLRPMKWEDITRRSALAEKGDFSDPMFDLAKHLTEADAVLIEAPFWDGSFPSMLKCWLEHVSVNGLTFAYDEKGVPRGKLKATDMWYVTTVGGYLDGINPGYENAKYVLCNLFGVKNAHYADAQGLDLVGNDPESIMGEAIQKLPDMV